MDCFADIPNVITYRVYCCIDSIIITALTFLQIPAAKCRYVYDIFIIILNLINAFKLYQLIIMIIVTIFKTLNV